MSAYRAPLTDSTATGSTRRAFCLATLAALATAACGRIPARTAPANQSASDPHWGYEGPDGPDHWADLTHDYAVCGTGHAQSPIDLPGDLQFAGKDISIDYAAPLPSIEIANNGHTWQINTSADNGNRLVINGVPYELVQFHFHSPSEHTVSGHGTSMELHLVHKNAEGNLAVLGVLMQEQPDDSAFRPVLMNGPKMIGAQERVPGPIDLRDYLPSDLGQYQYQGSLTTPPCTEGVTWTVLRVAVPVGVREAARFRSVFQRDNRPTQPANGRTIVPTEH